MRRSIRSMVMATAVVVLLFSFTMLATAQGDREAMGALYKASASVETNIPGVRTFHAPPTGFTPLTASDTELATYGFPPRPSKESDPQNYAKWAKAMAAVKVRWNGKLTDMGVSSMPGKPAPAGAAAPTDAASASPGTVNYYNWSGFANTNKLKTWNKNTSFYYVVSEFNVPVAQQPFGACDGGWDWEVSWAGIDGFSNGDVLQGGSSSEAYCNGGSKSTYYCGWVEWYPSYDILCEFGVNPGDDIFAEPYDPTGGFNDGYVYIEDETTGTVGTYTLSYVSGPALVGNSADYIVERPCCRSGDYYPLANYVWDFWAGSYAEDFKQYDDGLPVTYYPGSMATTTYLINMVNDQNTETISYPQAQGKFGIFFQDNGCANSGGCTP